MAGYVLHCTFLCGSNHLETKLQAVEQGDKLRFRVLYCESGRDVIMCVTVYKQTI